MPHSAWPWGPWTRCTTKPNCRRRPWPWPRAWAQDINPRRSLDRNDGHGFFQALGDSVHTGPTLTNVNDFRAIVVDGMAHGPA